VQSKRKHENFLENCTYRQERFMVMGYDFV